MTPPAPICRKKERMKMMKPTRRWCPAAIGALCALAAAPASAQEGGYFYGGLSLGQSQARIDDERINASLLGAGLATTSMSLDESHAGYKLFAGYQLNRYLALEGGYFNLGKFSYTATTVPAGTLHGQIKLQGLNLDLVGTLPITDRFSAIGRVGVQVAKARDSFSGTGAVQVADPSPSKRDTNYKLGVGLQYEVNPSFLVRAEAERYRINDAVGNRGDVNLYSVTLVFPFGRTAPQPVSAQASPRPAEPLPPAAPLAVVAPPPPPPPRRVSIAADSLFRFDQSVLQPEGRAALDKFTQELRGASFDMVKVEGHTDRLGGAEYNQRLSVRRADAVKAYLVTAGGVEAARISAAGKGETVPVTKPGECVGQTPSKALIACLQPDRRVEIETNATR